MKDFRDAENRTWKIDLNCDTVQQAKDVMGCNVLDLIDTESALFAQVLEFPVLVAKIVHVLCQEQIEKAGIDERTFRRAMNGDALSDATEALRSEIVNFSPRSTRPAMQRMMEKQREAEEKGMALVMAKIDDPRLMQAVENNMRQKIEEAINRVLVTPSSSDAGGPPVSLAFIPDASLGVN